MTTPDREDRLTWLAFATLVLVGSGNGVAIRFSNRELAPFYGAGLRFAIASLLFFGMALIWRVDFPRGRALLGALVFGILNYAAPFGFIYWALLQVRAGQAQVILALIPLLTLLLAIAHRQERFRWSGIGGAILALFGVATIFWSGTSRGGGAPLTSLAAIPVGAACIAEAAVLVKLFPRVHPASLNAVAMALAAGVLLTISAAAGERWTVPSRSETWIALGFISVIGSVVVFSLFLYVLRRWLASRASYQFVLFPIGAVVLSSLLDHEPLTLSLLLGGVLVISGVYVGSLASSPARPDPQTAGVADGLAPAAGQSE